MGNQEYYEDEIDLFELIHLLLKNKKTIALVTAAITAITVAVTVFIIKPQYQAELKFNLKLPTNIATDYGEYATNIAANQDIANILGEEDVYVVLSEEFPQSDQSEISIKNSISLAQDAATPMTFSVKISNTDTEFIKALSQVLPNAYIAYVDNNIQDKYLEYYKVYYESEIATNKRNLEITNELLANAKKIADKEPKFLDGTSEINPNWIKTQGYVLDHLKTIEDCSTYIEIAQKKLKMIEEEQAELDKNQPSSQKFKSEIMVLSNKEEIVINQISPNLKLNTAIGFVLGLMIAIFYVFAREWWKNSKMEIKTRWNRYK